MKICQRMSRRLVVTSQRRSVMSHDVRCHDLYQILGPYVELFSHESADRHTDRHTDGTDFIPSTADAGGNEVQGYLFFENPLRETCLSRNQMAVNKLHRQEVDL